MNIIYSDNEGVNVEAIRLNGRDGAVSVYDDEDDLDLTFEDEDTLATWVVDLVHAARGAGFRIDLREIGQLDNGPQVETWHDPRSPDSAATG